MNYLLRLIMVGLLVVVCVWGIQPAALEDIETLSPSLLLTNQELVDIPTEMLVEQPEMHVSKTARAILDQFPYLSASATEKVHKNAANLVATTYQSNDSSLKSTGGDGSHDSSTKTGSSTDDKKNTTEFYVFCVIISILALLVMSMIGLPFFILYKYCTRKSTGSKMPITKARPPSKHYYREAPSLLRSSRHNV
jgi:hypothetical protein